MKKTDPQGTDNTENVEESRRRFLKKAGKLAVYTPPAMALMMQPSHAHFLRSGGVTDLEDKLLDYENKYPEWQSFWDRIRQWLSDYNHD